MAHVSDSHADMAHHSMIEEEHHSRILRFFLI